MAGDSGGGVSDQVRRSEVEVCGFLTGVPLCILPLVVNLSVEVSQGEIYIHYALLGYLNWNRN